MSLRLFSSHITILSVLFLFSPQLFASIDSNEKAKVIAQLLQTAAEREQPVAFATGLYQLSGDAYFRHDHRKYFGFVKSVQHQPGSNKLSFRFKRYSEYYHSDYKSMSLRITDNLVAPRKTGSVYLWGSVHRLERIKKLSTANLVFNKLNSDNLSSYVGHYISYFNDYRGDKSFSLCDYGILSQTRPTRLVSTAYGYNFTNTSGVRCDSGGYKRNTIKAYIYEPIESVE